MVTLTGPWWVLRRLGYHLAETQVKRVKRQLARERANKDTRGLMNDLSTTVRPNFAATGNPKMYSEVGSIHSDLHRAE